MSEARKLEKWRALRIALVGKPATKMGFFVIKEETEMGDEKWETMFPLDAEEAEAFKTEAQGKEAVKKALTLLTKWKEDLPAEVLKAVAILAKAVGYGDAYGYARPKKEDAEAATTTPAPPPPEKKEDGMSELKGLLTQVLSKLSEKRVACATTPEPSAKEGESFTAEELLEGVAAILREELA